jgi:hypothetical protein
VESTLSSLWHCHRNVITPKHVYCRPVAGQAPFSVFLAQNLWSEMICKHVSPLKLMDVSAERSLTSGLCRYGWSLISMALEWIIMEQHFVRNKTSRVTLISTYLMRCVLGDDFVYCGNWDLKVMQFLKLLMFLTYSYPIWRPSRCLWQLNGLWSTSGPQLDIVQYLTQLDSQLFLRESACVAWAAWLSSVTFWQISVKCSVKFTGYWNFRFWSSALQHLAII